MNVSNRETLQNRLFALFSNESPSKNDVLRVGKMLKDLQTICPCRAEAVTILPKESEEIRARLSAMGLTAVGEILDITPLTIPEKGSIKFNIRTPLNGSRGMCVSALVNEPKITKILILCNSTAFESPVNVYPGKNNLDLLEAITLPVHSALLKR